MGSIWIKQDHTWQDRQEELPPSDVMRMIWNTEECIILFILPRVIMPILLCEYVNKISPILLTPNPI